MNHQRKTKPPMPTARQAKFDLAMSERWQQFCDSDQQACRQALALLLHEVMSQQPGNKQDER